MPLSSAQPHGRTGRPTKDDLDCIAGQLGRPRVADLQPVRRVVARCPHGLPAVAEALPYDATGRPFPTLFYLTCPTAVAAVGLVEAGGGVRRFAALLAAARQSAASPPDRDAAALAASLRAAERYERRRRRTLARGPAAASPARFTDGGASLHLGHRRRGRPVRRSSACTATPPTLWPVRPTRWGGACSTKRPPPRAACGATTCAAGASSRRARPNARETGRRRSRHQHVPAAPRRGAGRRDRAHRAATHRGRAPRPGGRSHRPAGRCGGAAHPAPVAGVRDAHRGLRP